ncbi:hypothetical protein [Corallococcus sp. CA053C]|uniref:hypothetical protein n=1 Tax=Corallococcus sp. CA053C TaxID=2316732 RepID=UPI0018F7303D|nr:hypothetical protein [Corallococcus sp. CA053C]
MKAKILAGAIAALMYGTGAVAAEKDCPPGQAAVYKDKGQQEMTAQASPGTVQEEDDLVIEEAPADDSLQGTGGSGSSPTDESQNQGSSQQGLSDLTSGKGGSGAIYLNTPLRCEPVDQSGTGGSGGEIAPPSSQQPMTPPPAAAEPPAPPPAAAEPPAPPPAAVEPPAHPPESADATGGSGVAAPPAATDFSTTNEDLQPLEAEKKDKNDKKGLTLLVGGGVEGYTGALAPQIAPGPSAAVTASLKPTSVLGIEVGYTGALNNIKGPGDESGFEGPDLVRNGGQAALTLAVSPSAVQPYLLGGIGVSNYHFRWGESRGFSDDTVGNLPAGVGVRGHFGHFTADLRGYYNFLFDKQFAPNIEAGGGDPSGGGSYATTLNVGGTF